MRPTVGAVSSSVSSEKLIPNQQAVVFVVGNGQLLRQLAGVPRARVGSLPESRQGLRLAVCVCVFTRAGIVTSK